MPRGKATCPITRDPFTPLSADRSGVHGSGSSPDPGQSDGPSPRAAGSAKARRRSRVSRGRSAISNNGGKISLASANQNVIRVADPKVGMAGAVVKPSDVNFPGDEEQGRTGEESRERCRAIGSTRPVAWPHAGNHSLDGLIEA